MNSGAPRRPIYTDEIALLALLYLHGANALDARQYKESHMLQRLCELGYLEIKLTSAGAQLAESIIKGADL